MSRCDVLFHDEVGMPYTGSTPARGGLGGSESALIEVAQALAGVGRSVRVRTHADPSETHAGVSYESHRDALPSSCDTLVVQRYSRVPPVPHRRLIVWAHDMPDRAYDHHAAALSAGAATLVCVSDWQRSLYPADWLAVVIPNIVPAAVYAAAPSASHEAGRFVYASAALKGLPATLAWWAQLRREPALRDAELRVCSPGYDAPPAGMETAGVRWLGALPQDALVAELAAAEALFYVNRFPETFCLIAAMAEALGTRTHVLADRGFGALRDTVRSPLVTDSRDAFARSVLAAAAAPGEAGWHGAPRDYRAAAVLPRWLELMEL